MFFVCADTIKSSLWHMTSIACKYRQLVSSATHVPLQQFWSLLIAITIILIHCSTPFSSKHCTSIPDNDVRINIWTVGLTPWRLSYSNATSVCFLLEGALMWLRFMPSAPKWLKKFYWCISLLFFKWVCQHTKIQLHQYTIEYPLHINSNIK